jgi:transcription initiation protein SPT3
MDETYWLVEDIVRVQVVELIIQAVQQAKKRGSKTINPDDLIFLLRHDRARVHRLKAYLSWKEVRRLAKDKDGKPADVADDLMEENSTQPTTQVPMFKQKKVRFGWDPLVQYTSLLTQDDEDEDDEQEAYQDQLSRLKKADDMTAHMNHDEYILYSECRQASFVYKKAKKFREWCSLHLHYDQKLTPDLLDTLGFLSYEMVGKLTEAALQVRKEWEDAKVSSNTRGPNVLPALFDAARDTARPLEPSHVQEAYRRLQLVDPCVDLFGRGSVRTGMVLI